MKYTIEIDDKTKAGKGLIEVAKAMAKKYKTVRVSKLDEEAIEDKALGLMMEKSLKSGLADEDEVLRELGIK